MVRSIEYNEGGEPVLDYKSVDLWYHEGDEQKIKKFDTGDFVKDWFDCLKHIIHMETEHYY